MKVEIWSDVLCPWCYIGKREFEKALEQYAHKSKVEVIWHSFELDPHAQRDYGLDVYDHLAKKYNLTRERAKEMNKHLVERAVGAGLTYHMDIVKPTNSFDAHRLIQLAKKNGLEWNMVERLSAAYLTEGKHIGDPETLTQLAVEVGLDKEEVTKVLASDEFGYEVRTDEQEASQLGIQGVPYFVIDRKYGISGGQPADVFLEALQNIGKELYPEELNGDVCTPDGICAPVNS
jgi:predicted DsbA family dithiol-disulfide isomerase